MQTLIVEGQHGRVNNAPASQQKETWVGFLDQMRDLSGGCMFSLCGFPLPLKTCVNYNKHLFFAAVFALGEWSVSACF